MRREHRDLHALGEVSEAIRAIFTRLTDEGVDACLGAMRVVGGSLDRVAMLRIGDAERRADKAETETAEVVAIGEKIEAELSATTIRISELEQAVADAQRREDRLAGRLELREADLVAALQSRIIPPIASRSRPPDLSGYASGSRPRFHARFLPPLESESAMLIHLLGQAFTDLIEGC